MAEATAFNVMEPPHRITAGTTGAAKNEFRHYPRHLHKPFGQYVVVTNAAEQADKIEQGWSLTPVLTEPEPEPVTPRKGKGKE